MRARHGLGAFELRVVPTAGSSTTWAPRSDATGNAVVMVGLWPARGAWAAPNDEPGCSQSPRAVLHESDKAARSLRMFAPAWAARPA